MGKASASRSIFLILASWLAFSVGRASGQELLWPPYQTVNLGLGSGARPVAMGGAFMAVAEGLAAIGDNPAGLARLRRPELMLGASYDSQATHAPAWAYDSFDMTVRLASSAYRYRITAIRFDHAAAAVRIKGGRQQFVVALSCRRELALPGTYSYSVARSAPRGVFGMPPGVVVEGQLNGMEDYAVDDTVTLDVYTATIAFRVARNLDLGINANIRHGSAARRERVDSVFAVTDGGTAVAGWEGYEQTVGSESLSAGTNAELGVLWTTGRFSLAASFRTAYHVHVAGALEKSERTVYSTGAIYERQEPQDVFGSLGQPAQYGIGLAFRPWRAWTVAAEYRKALDRSFHGPETPLFLTTGIRAGIEYRLGLGRLILPLRAGAFLAKTDDMIWYPKPWLSGFTVGTGLAFGRFVLDVAAIFHRKSVEHGEPIRGPLTRSVWILTASLSCRL